MNVFTTLKQDHERVLSLFTKLRAQQGGAERQELFRTIKTELEQHSQIEDLHVYRVFQQAEPTRDSAAAALEAHRRIQVLLDELTALSPDNGRWTTQIGALNETVESHVRSEEQDMFAKAASVMTAQEAEELGAAVERARQVLKGKASPPAGGIPA